MGLKVEIVESAEGMAALRPAWDALLAQRADANPFLGFAWAEAWLSTVGSGARPFVLVARDAEAVKGIAPLCVRAGTLSFVGYPQSDYADLLIDADAPECVAQFAQTIAAQRGRWRRACLDQMHEQRSHALAFADALAATGLPLRRELGDYCPAMSLADRAAAKKQYYKKNIANYVNWFKRQGDFAFEHYDQLEVAMSRLEDLFAQHIERWDGTPTPSSFLRPEMQEFYRSFVRALLPGGAVQFFGLRLDEGHLAFFLCLQGRDTLYLYKPSYNLQHRAHSPGQVILRYLLDYGNERELAELDYGRGDEGYKDRFSNLSRRSHRILLYQNGFVRQLAEWRHALRYSAPVEALLQRPAVRRWLTRLRG